MKLAPKWLDDRRGNDPTQYRLAAPPVENRLHRIMVLSIAWTKYPIGRDYRRNGAFDYLMQMKNEGVWVKHISLSSLYAGGNSSCAGRGPQWIC